jgi:hypothetical protein
MGRCADGCRKIAEMYATAAKSSAALVLTCRASVEATPSLRLISSITFLDEEHHMKKVMAGLSIVLALAAATPAFARSHAHRAHPATYGSTYDPSDWHTWPPSKANDVPWAPF